MSTFKASYLIPSTLLGFLLILFVLFPGFLYTAFYIDKFIMFDSTLEATALLILLFLLFTLLYALVNYLLVPTKSISFDTNHVIITSGILGMKKDKIKTSQIKSLKLVKIFKTLLDITETEYRPEDMQRVINKQLQAGQFKLSYKGGPELKRYLLIEMDDKIKLFYMTGWNDKKFNKLHTELEKILGSKAHYMDYTPKNIK